MTKSKRDSVKRKFMRSISKELKKRSEKGVCKKKTERVAEKCWDVCRKETPDYVDIVTRRAIKPENKKNRIETIVKIAKNAESRMRNAKDRVFLKTALRLDGKNTGTIADVLLREKSVKPTIIPNVSSRKMSKKPTLEEKLKEKGLKRIDNEGGGDCLYLSVMDTTGLNRFADMLNITVTDRADMVQQTRDLCGDSLNRYADLELVDNDASSDERTTIRTRWVDGPGEECFGGESIEDWEKYLKNVRTMGKWGDDKCIQGLSLATGIVIKVLSDAEYGDSIVAVSSSMLKRAGVRIIGEITIVHENGNHYVGTAPIRPNSETLHCDNDTAQSETSGNPDHDDGNAKKKCKDVDSPAGPSSEQPSVQDDPPESSHGNVNDTNKYVKYIHRINSYMDAMSVDIVKLKRKLRNTS